MVTIVIRDKIDVKTKPLTRDKEEPGNSTSGYLFKETQNIKSKRHMYSYNCSIIYNSQNMEAM